MTERAGRREGLPNEAEVSSGAAAPPGAPASVLQEGEAEAEEEEAQEEEAEEEEAEEEVGQFRG